MYHMTLRPHNTCLTVLALAEAAMKLDWISFETINVPCCQRPLSSCLHEASYHHLIESASGFRSRALALSSALQHVRDCLNNTLFTTLSRSSTTGQGVQVKPVALAGVAYVGGGRSMSHLPDPDRCLWRSPCRLWRKRDRLQMYDSIGDVLFFAAQSAAVAPRKQGPSLIPSFSGRPADVCLPNWLRGQPAALNVHDSHLHVIATNPGRRRHHPR